MYAIRSYYGHPGGTSLAPGNTMDNQLVFDVFSNFISASEILGLDENLADTVQSMLTQLPPMQIGQHSHVITSYSIHYTKLYEWTGKPPASYVLGPFEEHRRNRLQYP